MKGLVIAIQFLTRIPLPRVSVSNAEFAASIRWFPTVGAIIGALVALAGLAGLHLDDWCAALAGLAIWVWVTGALHLDGLGDVADAAGAAHKDRERLLRVLADPHMGSFGVAAIGLQLLAKLVLLHRLFALGLAPALPAVGAAARLGPLVWSRWLTPLHEGLGSRFRTAVRPVDLVAWTVVLVAASVVYPPLWIVVPGIAGWGLWLRHRLGGISGDGHGAGIEILETTLLLALVAGVLRT
ncbi:cobalamin-5-phosphate synthase CobS [Novosphingobium nitrogenifigens DSM 19370]|uniref:Adenosylcobinamide-GDP ribazoletransferase n=1 Tax=Novosphingobium nitrogenifigens DSM 19370 TaxID=983920 RepID=F1Z394_9SPHN|nr:adenosylcobinamide-GDP ribazoletransferase [Novosphingobium nitrogenifigens]EGD60919.1 cobalamin-5-phosphate synthase CobS [Novosphingobium nitrogenifigens DSM 19370]